LLERYVASRDEEAFEALVSRHGPMVLGVCRRLLRDPHDAHDAFQATFLVLVQKAASVVPAERLPNWLHGVARQTAVRARSAAARRRQRERQVLDLPEREARPAPAFDDLRDTLDEELACLPARYRDAVVVCDLEGRGQQEAARHLGWPVGTLASRLFRGRRLLARRLAGRGVALSSAALAALLAPEAVSAALVSSTVRVGSLVAAGESAAVAAGVAALSQGVVRAMFMKKVKLVVLGVLVAGAVALGGGLLTRQAEARQPEAAPAPKPSVARRADVPKEKKDLLEVRADGKQVVVRAMLDGEELYAVAQRMTYDEDSRRLVLEGNVKVQRRRGRQTEHIECKTMVIDRKARSIKVVGAGQARSKPDSPHKDVLVNVQESSTGSLMFGVGVNSNSGLEGSIVLNERNFDVTRPPTKIDDLTSAKAFRGAGQEFMVRFGTQTPCYMVRFVDSGTVTVGRGLRVVVPMLGPLPIGLDLGFPVVKDKSEQEQVFNFFMGFTR
jgi:RNA polymerase sigma factor (sigma-70 family)